MSENSNICFLSGDEALAQGAYEAGLAFAAAYPGTPSTEILEYLSRFPEVNSQWSVNEKVAYEVAYGAAVAGVRSLYASKHVGLNVAMDPLMTSAYTGINAGFVIVTADDPGLHSSQNEQDNRLIARFAKLPLLEPSSPSEAKAFFPYAFELSEKFDTPVLVRITTRVAHTKENVTLGERREAPARGFKPDPAKYVMVPRNAFLRHVALEKRLLALQEEADKSPLNRVELNDPGLGIIVDSVSYLYAKEIFPSASFLKLGFVYPFPEKMIREFAGKVKEVLVIEELEPFIEEEVARVGIRHRAKHPSWRIGELTPGDIQAVADGKEKVLESATTRKPVMCPGCPHRGVYSVLRKLKLTVTGDIGCYTLGALPPLGVMQTCLCMGAGITMFEGFRKVLGKDVVGVIGDSTFVHSGITGLVNAVYNLTRGLIIILDNSTTAMTGTQPHPATGETIKGVPTKKLVLENLCKACGVDQVDVVSAYDTEQLEEVIKARVNADALSVLIARTPCKLIDKKKREPVTFTAEHCKKCGLCLNVGCPALSKAEDGMIKVDKSYCVGCYVCVSYCKFDALKKTAAAS
ncbi:MAG: indolepyruvate ferredoxin oxidoreductase subunit alpha [Candidatus Omnitrophica bacterium]|nr:indolepyruvate ferredoxin oxidoreductase subunit alpha [Candidatus Omnitrophota bacterium]